MCIALTFVLYWPCLTGGFIWDDQFLVNKNPFIRSPLLITESFRHFLGEDPTSNFYRPVQNISYILDYWRGGLSPIIFRQSNYVIHGLNAGLFFVFLSLTLRRHTQLASSSIRKTAILSALIWLVHPVHSASIAYISGRADSLALFFLLLAWCCWEKRRDANGQGKLILSLGAVICAFLAICSKEAALMGVGFFLVFETVIPVAIRRAERRKIIGGCVLLGVVYLCLRYGASSLSEPSNAPPPWMDRPNLVLRGLGDYFRLLLFPLNLRMERQVIQVSYLYVNPVTFDPVYPFLGIVGSIFLGGLIFSYFKKGTCFVMRRLGVLWFILTILPVSNVFALNSTVAEHWLYIPSIGFIIVIMSWCLEAGKKVQTLAAYLCVLAILAFSQRTWRRAHDWTDSITFFKATIRDGGDTPRMRVNLADEYRLRGNLKEGETLLREVVQRSPRYVQARHSLMVNLRSQGRNEEAEKLVPSGDEPFGDSFRGKLYTADNLLVHGNLSECGAKLKRLRQLYPDSWLVTVEMSLLLEKLGHPEQKVVLVESFVRNHWWHLASHIELADLYANNPKRQSEAVQNLLEVSRLDIRDVSALSRASDIMVQSGHYSMALKIQEEALERNATAAQQEKLAELKEVAAGNKVP